MNTLALTAANLGMGGSGIAAVLGYAVVFFGLVLLMCVVILMGKAMAGRTNAPARHRERIMMRDFTGKASFF